MLLIVGLGNPGMKYKNTYHNAGFMTVDALASELGLKIKKSECDSHTAKGEYKGREFVLAKPDTYMNNSGDAVKKLVKAYDADPRTELLVCYDDVDLPLAKLRFRETGSAGTHNGMRSIVAALNSEDFFRLRIGTMTEELKNGEIALIDFVLSKIDFASKQQLQGAIEKAKRATLMFVAGEPINKITEQLNR